MVLVCLPSYGRGNDELDEFPEVPESAGSASHPDVAIQAQFVRFGGMSCSFGLSPGI